MMENWENYDKSNVVDLAECYNKINDREELEELLKESDSGLDGIINRQEIFGGLYKNWRKKMKDIIVLGKKVKTKKEASGQVRIMARHLSELYRVGVVSKEFYNEKITEFRVLYKSIENNAGLL